jgi:hypothetical protein
MDYKDFGIDCMMAHTVEADFSVQSPARSSTNRVSIFRRKEDIPVYYSGHASKQLLDKNRRYRTLSHDNTAGVLLVYQPEI